MEVYKQDLNEMAERNVIRLSYFVLQNRCWKIWQTWRRSRKYYQTIGNAESKYIIPLF